METGRQDGTDAVHFEDALLGLLEHDMRSGLNGVIGMAELLLDGGLSPEQREFAQTVRRCGEDVLTLVDDALGYARLRSGEIRLDPEPCDLARLLAACREDRRLRSRQNRLTIADLDLPGLLVIDGGLLQRLLVFLLGRVLENGDDQVQVTCRYDVEHGQVVLIITAACAPAVLLGEVGASISVDRSRAVRHGLVRGLLRLLGAELQAAEAPGAVAVLIPCGVVVSMTAAEPLVSDALPVERQRSVRVLVVDDNLVNQRLLRHDLTGLGCRVDLAGDGRDALAALGQRRYDLVLMDIQLPIMDGLEATRLLRASEQADGLAPVPVIGMTATTDAEVRADCLSVGMNDHLIKPLRRDDLAALIDRWSSANDAHGGARGVSSEVVPAVDLDAVIDDAVFNAQLAPIIADAPEIISESIDEMEVDARALLTAIDGGAVETINKTAHRLVSSAGALAAMPLAELARRIDERTRSGEDAVIECAQVPDLVERSLAALRDRL